MGDFQSYKLLIGTTVYFFFMFLVVTASISSDVFSDTDDLGFDNDNFRTDTTATASTDASTGFSTVLTTFSVMSGIGSGNVSLGEPVAWHWLISFILFWIPLALWLLGVYFAVPLLH